MRRNMRGISLEYLRATLLAFLLSACFNFSASWPLGEKPTAVLLPMKLFKSSALKDVGEAESGKSAAAIGLDSYRLPPSPANLLKPDRFQFYTYNERGDMITKQMTMQEIQALIAGGGPDHSNVEIQQPQKAEDILTGGKKVMDVVEKVQSVLKSAMGKPLSALTSVHEYPSIPEKANAEWSNILPAILAADKYPNKVEEIDDHVEKATLKPTTTSSPTIHDDSSSDSDRKSNTSVTVSTEQREKGEAAGASKRNETSAMPSTIVPEIATASYTEKLMIPVSVITAEQTDHHTTHSPIFHKITQFAASSGNVTTYQHSNEKEEQDVQVASAATNATTINSTFVFESTTNSNGSADSTSVPLHFQDQVITHRTDTSTARTKTKDTVDPTTEISSSLLQLTQLDGETEASVANESFATFTLPLQSAVTIPNEYTNIKLAAESSNDTEHDRVTGFTDVPSTEQPSKPLSAQLIDSLSSVIGQVSEEVSSVLRPVPSANAGDDNSWKITSSVVRTTTVASVIYEEISGDRNDTDESLHGETINKLPSSVTKTDPVKKTNHSEKIWTDTRVALNATNVPTNEPTNLHFSKPVAIIQSMLDAASTATNNAAVTEPITFPNNLPGNFSASTLASALIAGFHQSSDLGETEITTSYDTTPSTQERSNSTAFAELEDNGNSESDTEREGISTEKEDPLHESTRKQAIGLETTDRTTTSVNAQTQQHQPSVASQSATISPFSSPLASVQHTLYPTYEHTSASNTQTIDTNDRWMVVEPQQTEKARPISEKNNQTCTTHLDLNDTTTTPDQSSTSMDDVSTTWMKDLPTEQDLFSWSSLGGELTNFLETNSTTPYFHTKQSSNKEEKKNETEGNKTEINERLSSSTTLENALELNSTDKNSQHTWQRVSLHQTTSKPSWSTVWNALTKNSTRWQVGTEAETESQLQSTVSLDASKSIGGLDTSTRNASVDVANFSRLCNQLAMKFWTAANKGLSNARSLVLSPFGMISLLSMIFLGARGSTSEQMNEVLGLDNVATFNPHLIFQNVTDAVSLARHQGIANAAFVRELFADKAKVRKLLPFYKEQAQQFYEGLVAEVNFATISDLARRRTNLLVRKQTGGRIKDFVKSNAVPLRSPLAAISANVFQTDCNGTLASSTGRDGELYFAVSSAHRLRKLIPLPAIVWRSSVLAGYEPGLDATAIALGGIEKLVSTIFLLPGQQGHVAPGDTLDRLEHRLVSGAFRDATWEKLLKVLIPRTGLELQIPKFSHRSVVNATAALKTIGLDQLFSNDADFKGINGIANRLFLSDVLQMNLFSTCGDQNTANGRHHVEIYPTNSSLRNSRYSERFDTLAHAESKQNDTLQDTTRNVERTQDRPRLKLDQPFLYFVRHNPTGLILHMGRFNPRCLYLSDNFSGEKNKRVQADELVACLHDLCQTKIHVHLPNETCFPLLGIVYRFELTFSPNLKRPKADKHSES